MSLSLFAGRQLPVLSSVGNVPQCGKCGLYKTCKTKKMEPSGNGRRRILIVGEAPGENEDREGKQFVGNAGYELHKALTAAGVDMRRDCWLTNALICRPPDNKINDKDAVDYCRPNLINTIRELKPEVIIVLGNRACESLIGWTYKESGQWTVSRWAGYRIPDQKLNAWICPTFHPSYVIREENPVLSQLFKQHVKAACKLDGRPWGKIPDYKSLVEVVVSPSEAAKKLRLALAFSKGTIAFDYETTCLKPEFAGAQIISCAICFDGKTTIAYPWAGEAIGETSKILRSRAVRKIGANIKFEERFTRFFLGHGVRNWAIDVNLSAHVLDNADKSRPITSVKFQSYVLCGAEDYAGHIKPCLAAPKGKHINRIKELDLPTLLEYNGLDALLEYKIAEKHAKPLGIKL